MLIGFLSKSEEEKEKEKKIEELSESIEFDDGRVTVRILKEQGVVLYLYDKYEGGGVSAVPIDQTEFSDMDLDRLEETLDV